MLPSSVACTGLRSSGQPLGLAACNHPATAMPEAMSVKRRHTKISRLLLSVINIHSQFFKKESEYSPSFVRKTRDIQKFQIDLF
jgi:hypothetical protein